MKQLFNTIHVHIFTKPSRLFFPVVAFICLISSCIKQDNAAPDAPGEILSVTLERADGIPFDTSEAIVDIQGDSINITLPFNTDVTHLIPEISIKGISISPASGEMQDFSSPVLYTVTASDNTKSSYIVTIRTAQSGLLVYAGSSDKTFYALDARTGKIIWKYESTNSFAYSKPAYDNGTVFVGGIDNYLYSFDALTGEIFWKFNAGYTGIESGPAVADGTVYVGCNDDYLYAVDEGTGRLKWQFLTGGNISTIPVVSGSTVYFGSSDGNFYALEAASGQQKWKYATGSMINASSAALADSTIYFGNRNGYLFALDAGTGSLKWKFSSGGISFEMSSAAISEGAVYIGGWCNVSNFSLKGSLYAINDTTGQLLFKAIDNTGIDSDPAISNSRLYITTDDGSLYCLDAHTGMVYWHKEILANGASPAVYNDIVYVGGGGTWNIYAFDAMTGVEKWRLPTTGLMTSTPLITIASKRIHPPEDSLPQLPIYKE